MQYWLPIFQRLLHYYKNLQILFQTFLVKFASQMKNWLLLPISFSLFDLWFFYVLKRSFFQYYYSFDTKYQLGTDENLNTTQKYLVGSMEKYYFNEKNMAEEENVTEVVKLFLRLF